MPPINPATLSKIHDLATLLGFLRDTNPANGLGWPIRDDLDPEELFYDYDQGDFRQDGQGEGLQLRQLAKVTRGQPWGVFLVQTSTPRLYTSQLRRIVRVLAPKARNQLSYLPSWPLENLLFVATHNFKQFTFAHLRGEENAAARISSFGWSQAESGVRTLCEYNLPALRWPENPEDGQGWLGQWSTAFDVEKVTDRFFKDFRDLFESRKEALEGKIRQPAERHAFVQRLLNRLLFLSFLQKKRWLKAPNTEHPQSTYLFDLFDQAESRRENFYQVYLNGLFFNALNRPLEIDAASYKEVQARLGIVPFLNGGLFDRADEWDEAGRLSLENEFFGPILGHDGLLRRYNFTVTESTPLNQEVAVDPEMLGKVFETVVLTSEGAENYQAPNLRKATGSYYTPRIVVTFIVREALKSDLTARVPGLRRENLARLMEWDALAGLTPDDRSKLRELVSGEQADAILQRLGSLRACDPSIGSGAFALGLLHELLNLRLLCENITKFKDPLREPNAVFDLKKQIIENNIYGVDLQAKAVEICKLRLWLSMIVDYELSVDPDASTPAAFAAAVKEIPALPNLGFKIRRGDALLDLVQGKVFRLKEISHQPEMQAAVSRLQDIHNRFFSENDPDKKRFLRLQALTERTRLSRLQIEMQLKALEDANATQEDMFAAKQTKAALRTAQDERQRLEAVLAEVCKTETELQKLAQGRLDEQHDTTLTRLEALRESEEITFAWELDFPEIFFEAGQDIGTLTGRMGLVNEARGQMELSLPRAKRGGFDIMVGNPPFVTARNAEKRELYRERWKETAFLKYQLVSPFFQRSFGLLRPSGHLGFIVSNAFAKREFGRPLVEKFFPTIELQKIVDCSGLMFPGHGTPTCIIFGKNQKPDNKTKIRITATLPGGGDLKTIPEKSPLWATIQSNYDAQNYKDDRIIVADQPRKLMAVWPWNLDVRSDVTKQVIEQTCDKTLADFIEGDVGVCTMTNEDELFPITDDHARRLKLDPSVISVFQEGEDVRDWVLQSEKLLLNPYNDNAELLPEKKLASAIPYLKQYKEHLENRLSFANKTFKELGREWYSFERMNKNKYANPRFIVFGEIATHAHFVYHASARVYKQTCQTIKLPTDSDKEHIIFQGWLNSSVSLFWLKQVCFNKNASDQEEKDRFVYAGGKVQMLPISNTFTSKESKERKQIFAFSLVCWENGQKIPSLGYRKLFEQPGEAYHTWYSELAGYMPPDASLQAGWRTTAELRSLFQRALAERERLRAEMIALQEEMDWLVYAAYGLINDDDRLTAHEGWQVEPLQLGERPFELLRDGKPIPEHFSAGRKALWQARIDEIQANEHIRRIEQPVYKRRWYRKTSDAQELERACNWFVLEKAEWWLENVHKRAVAPERWAAALWEDERIRAAVQVVDENIVSLTAFTRWFKSLLKDASVPAWIPPAMPWDQVEKQFKNQKIPASAKKIRGKLNVPRERFRIQEDGQYVWAGEG